jgi:hypothetical protein
LLAFRFDSFEAKSLVWLTTKLFENVCFGQGSEQDIDVGRGTLIHIHIISNSIIQWEGFIVQGATLSKVCKKKDIWGDTVGFDNITLCDGISL